MAQPRKSAAKQFICSCQKEILSEHQIMDHLKLRITHNIRKIAPQCSKDFENSIFNKIAKIAKIQVQINACTHQLIQSITQNTSDIIEKLSNIISFYKHLIYNSPKANYNKNRDVVNTFKLSPPLLTALTQHFGQDSFVEKSTIESIAKNVKTQITDIWRNHVGGINVMAVFRDEKRVVTGGQDGALRIWDLETQSQIWFFLKHKDLIYSLALGKGEDLVLTGSADLSVRLWNVKSKLQVHKFLGHIGVVTCVLFSEDQNTGFSGSNDKTIRSWNLKSLTPQRSISFQIGISAICLIREEKTIVCCGGKGSVSLYNFKDSKHSKARSHHDSEIKSICFTPNEEQFITGSKDGTVEIWRTNGLKRHFFQKKHSDSVCSIKISTSSKLFATGSNDGTVIVWDLSKLHPIRLIQNQFSVNSLYFIKNSSSLLICWTFGINMCSLSTFVIQKKIIPKQLSKIEISSDLKYAAYGLYRVCLFDIENKTRVEKSSKIKKCILYLKFSPDITFLVAGCKGGEITVFSIPFLLQLCTLYSNLSNINFISFSKSNELIGFSDIWTSVQVISIKTKEVLYENKVVKAPSVYFCSNDEKFIYLDDYSICVLSENFSFLKKIFFNVFFRELFVNEDLDYILVRQLNMRWSLIKADSLKMIFKDESRKVLKEWCTRRQDKVFRIHLICPNRIF